MIAAQPTPTKKQTPLGILVLVVFAAATAGVALTQRGLNPVFIPVMAPAPVVMPDGRAFYAQRHEVTIAEWNRCARQGSCDMTLRARAGQNPEQTPATGLNYEDAQQYLKWLNRTSGQNFRLPTAQEWRVMAQEVLPEKPDPIFTDPSLSWASNYLVKAPTPRAIQSNGSFSTSPQGIADLDGSVWEWTSECYDGTPITGDEARCPAFFVGGEHIAAMSFLVRDPARGGCAVGSPPAHLGMRLISDSKI